MFDWSSVYIEATVTAGPVSIELTERLAHGQEYLVTFRAGRNRRHTGFRGFT
jgi:hypothetical protein